MRKIILVVLSLLIFCSTSKPKKEYSLKDLDGTIYKFSDFKGKILIVDFWATWCPPCLRAIPHLIELHEKYQDQGVMVIGISTDRDLNKLRRFVEQKEIPYLILIADQKIVDEYEIKAIPTIFLFDKKGSIITRHVGYSSQAMAEFDRKIAELIEK